MTQSRSEVPILLAALGLSVALLAGGGWWLGRRGLLGFLPGLSKTSAPAEPEVDTFEQVEGVPSGQFRYGGSTTWAPIRGEVDPQLQLARPEFRLSYTQPSGEAPGSGAGVNMLVAGELDFAQTSRPLTAAERAASVDLREIPVVREGIAIATHPDLPLEGLTLDQLKAIYTGQVTNWSDVGGPDLAIAAIARSDVGGTVAFVQSAVLDGEAYSPAVRQASTTTEALRLTAETPGSLYFASAPEIVGQCTVKPLPLEGSGSPVPPYQLPYVPPSACPNQRNQPNVAAFADESYPLTRPLYVIVREDSPAAGEAYANLLRTQEGQRLLRRAGFAPLR